MTHLSGVFLPSVADVAFDSASDDISSHFLMLGLGILKKRRNLPINIGCSQYAFVWMLFQSRTACRRAKSFVIDLFKYNAKRVNADNIAHGAKNEPSALSVEFNRQN
jgi:hypothetical protein